jgi:hypothetical protein
MPLGAGQSRVQHIVEAIAAQAGEIVPIASGFFGRERRNHRHAINLPRRRFRLEAADIGLRPTIGADLAFLLMIIIASDNDGKARETFAIGAGDRLEIASIERDGQLRQIAEVLPTGYFAQNLCSSPIRGREPTSVKRAASQSYTGKETPSRPRQLTRLARRRLLCPTHQRHGDGY